MGIIIQHGTVYDAAQVSATSVEKGHHPPALTLLQPFACQFRMSPPQGSGWLRMAQAARPWPRQRAPSHSGRNDRKLDRTPCGFELGKGRARDFVAKDVFDYWLQLLKLLRTAPTVKRTGTWFRPAHIYVKVQVRTVRK